MKNIKKINMKSESAITLVSLAVTIIVLIILAGISINLVAGGDGILNKAQNAVNVSNVAEAKERVNLKIAEFKTDFYKSVYVEKKTSVNVKLGDWIAKNYPGNINAGDYAFQVTGATSPYIITIQENNKLEKEIVGEMSVDGQIEWKDEVKNGSNSGSSGENLPSTLRTVKYDLNDGSGEVPASLEIVEGENVEVVFTPKPTKQGYEFVGWAEEKDATEAIYTPDGITMFTIGLQDVTLYAVWKENI